MMPRAIAGTKNSPTGTTLADRRMWQAHLVASRRGGVPASRATHHEPQLSVCNFFYIIAKPSKSAPTQHWLHRVVKI